MLRFLRARHLARHHRRPTLLAARAAAATGRQRSGELLQRRLQPALRLLLGLLSLAAYQNAEKINGFVEQEAASLGLLYRSSSSYPDPFRTDLQALARDYALYVIHKDWPAHEQGEILQGGAARLGVIRETLMSFEPATVNQEILQDHTLGIFNDLVLARVQRLSGWV